MNTTQQGDVPLLIAGLGNVLMTDAGVGVHAVRALLQAPPAGVTLAEVGTAVIDAIDLFTAAGTTHGRVLVLDAIRGGRRPGTVHQVELTEHLAAVQALHEPDLRAALRLIPADHRPVVTLLGMEPASIEYGLRLSPAVERMFVHFVTQVRRFAKAFGGSVWARRQPA